MSKLKLKLPSIEHFFSDFRHIIYFLLNALLLLSYITNLIVSIS